MIIKKEENPAKRGRIVKKIINGLSEWFGNKSTNKKYINQSKKLTLWSAKTHHRLAGFIAIEQHNEYAEIIVCGVKKRYQRTGVGKKLLTTAVDYCKLFDINYLIVKTLADSVVHDGYSKTRLFYEKNGFILDSVDLTIWDKENPCAIYKLQL